MKKASKRALEGTKALMGALLRQPPKQHEDMRVGRPQAGKGKKKPSKAPKKIAKRPD